ncbi:hypothetical protein AGOR_G00029870 [Albula goreensis]|uniref:Protein NPAT C-terminal domain-containing protein n=1 Tax=Albula goreensis TaxID=1534307 RepID=A0A8T3E9M8_9TELE|nr:hypothetical protein AGOR_G00029870 [Albula goreensis]
MLLPSDIARLVLGYLQQEGLRATTQAFILESPNLKEYAEHSTDDGAIPACVFSLFGKNLTTILNEYVAVKAKESCHDTQVPTMMTSLWKKLDFTLNQIKSMQNSPAVYQNQRFRTRNGIVNIRGQRALSSAARTPNTALLSIPPSSSQYDTSPLATPQGMLGHSTPVCYSSLQTRPSPLCVSQPPIQDGSRLVINMSRDSPLQIVVPDRRINSGPLSPGRRKCDSPRRRGGGLCGPSGTGRAAAPSSGPIPEQQIETHQEGVSENFPVSSVSKEQMVIENAREKILNDKSLQEKLAENINKILASDVNPQSSKQVACSTVVPDQSIDEILGLQGEIHMSDDAIRDILEQTESDPAFQALFDLFDYGKNKDSEGESPCETSLSNTTPESDEADSSSHTGDPGTSQEEATSVVETSSRATRTRSTQDHKGKKTRKTAHTLSNASKNGPAPTPAPSRPTNELRMSKRASSHTRTGATETRASGSTDRRQSPMQPRSKVQGIAGKDVSPAVVLGVSNSVPPQQDSSMEVDEPVEALVSPLSPVQPLAARMDDQEGSLQTSKGSDRQNADFPAGDAVQVMDSAVPCAQKPNRTGQGLRLPEGQMTQVQTPEVLRTEGAVETPGAHLRLCSTPSQTVYPHGPGEPSIARPGPPQACPDGQKAQVPEAMALPTATPMLDNLPSPLKTPLKEPDPSKIVSLKIIVSDEPDDQSGDAALSQAVSSITGEKLPTIILSSPAKSPMKPPPTPGSSTITQEETVQAVCCLQGADLSSLAGKAGETPMEESIQLSLASELSQEGGYIQLVPGGAPGNYFIVTEQSSVGQQSKVVVLPGCASLGQASPAPHMLATPPRPVISVAPDVSQTYSPGSTLFISSPTQPMLQGMMVPMSVVGQSSMGKFTVVQNQLLQVAAPAVKTPGKVKPKPKLAPKDQTDPGKTRASGTDKSVKVQESSFQQQPTAPKPQSGVRLGVPPHPTEAPVTASSGLPPVACSSPLSHRRVLCFDVSAENPAQARETPLPSEGPTPVPAAPVSAPSAQAASSGKPRAVQPAILRGSRSLEGKTRPETVKCTDLRKPSEASKESERRTAEQSASSSSSSSEQGAAQPEASKRRSESRRKSHQSEKKDEDGAPSVNLADPKHRTTSKPSGIPAKKQGLDERRGAERSDKGSKEARVERRSSSQQPLHVTANKENEVERGRAEQTLASTTTQGEATSTAASSPASSATATGGSSRAPSMTSPLTKQAAEMLQDIQGQNPTATPTKRTGFGSAPEEQPDCPRTPARQRLGKDSGEGTPRQLPPPATPEIPTCSPASEAGSENSINMAAHTLMILSRAAIARTGTPLKDSVRQQGATSSTTPKGGKKRKPAEPLPSPPAKKEPQQSGSASKKKAKKQKKMLDCFPDNLDVEKFLSSLHYDE